MRHAQWLPGKAEPRRPVDSVEIQQRASLICDQNLVVRLVGIVADVLKGSDKACETVVITPEVRAVFDA